MKKLVWITLLFILKTSIFVECNSFNQFDINKQPLSPLKKFFKNVGFNNEFSFTYNSALENKFQSRYINSSRWKINNYLTMRLRLGGLYNILGENSGKNFLSGVTLFYNPRSDFKMQLDYGNVNYFNRPALTFFMQKSFFNDKLSVSVFYSGFTDNWK